MLLTLNIVLSSVLDAATVGTGLLHDLNTVIDRIIPLQLRDKALRTHTTQHGRRKHTTQ